MSVRFRTYKTGGARAAFGFIVATLTLLIMIRLTGLDAQMVMACGYLTSLMIWGSTGAAARGAAPRPERQPPPPA